MIKYIFSVLLLAGLAPSMSSAQGSNGNSVPYARLSVFEKEQSDNVSNLYSQRISPSFEVINGREYLTYYTGTKYNPFLYFGVSHLSSVIINGFRYDGVAVNYDTFRDCVVYGPVRISENRSAQIELQTRNIDGFIMYYKNDTLRFSHISRENKPGFNLADGFYEVIYSGRSGFIISHRSIESVSNSIRQYEYLPERFIDTGKGYMLVKSRKQFFRLFGDKSKTIEKFMSASGITFRSMNKKELAKIMAYFDTLY